MLPPECSFRPHLPLHRLRSHWTLRPGRAPEVASGEHVNESVRRRLDVALAVFAEPVHHSIERTKYGVDHQLRRDWTDLTGVDTLAKCGHEICAILAHDTAHLLP